MCAPSIALGEFPVWPCSRLRDWQTLGVDAQFTLFEALYDNYVVCKAVTPQFCETIVNVITTKGFDPTYLLPLTAAMRPDREPVTSVQKTVLRSVLNPNKLHGLFQRRQIEADGKSVVVAEIVVRLVVALGIPPEALVTGAVPAPSSSSSAVVLAKAPLPLAKAASTKGTTRVECVASRRLCGLL